MHLLHQLLVLIELVSFAALLGGCLVQLRVPAPEVNLAMLYGALTQFTAGLGLLIWDAVGSGSIDIVKAVVQIVLAVIVLVLVALNRRFAAIPRGLLRLLTLLTLGNAAVAVLWT